MVYFDFVLESQYGQVTMEIKIIPAKSNNRPGTFLVTSAFLLSSGPVRLDLLAKFVTKWSCPIRVQLSTKGPHQFRSL